MLVTQVQAEGVSVVLSEQEQEEVEEEKAGSVKVSNTAGTRTQASC